MKKNRKPLSFLLVLALMLSMIPGMAFAEEPSGLKYPVCEDEEQSTTFLETYDEFMVRIAEFLVFGTEDNNFVDEYVFDGETAEADQAEFDALKAHIEVCEICHEALNPKALVPTFAIAASSVSVTTWGGMIEAISTAGITETEIVISGNFETTGGPITITPGALITITGSGIITRGALHKTEFFIVTGGAVLTISGITLDGSGQTITSTASLVKVKAGGSLTLMEGALLQNNNSSDYGGGVYNDGTFTMNTGSAIKSNKAPYGGGVYNEGTFTMNTGSAIKSNKAPRGGGVFNSSNIFNMIGGTISENEATGGSSRPHGGGVYNRGIFTMYTGSAIESNTAVHDGGGVCNISTFTMIGGTISKNISKGTGLNESGGGGVHNGSHIFNMEGGIIENNTAATYGGGVYGGINMSGGAITNNTASEGGGVLIASKSSIYGDSTIVGNTANGKPSNIGFAANSYIEKTHDFTAGKTYGLELEWKAKNPANTIDYRTILSGASVTAADLIYFTSETKGKSIKYEDGKLIVVNDSSGGGAPSGGGGGGSSPDPAKPAQVIVDGVAQTIGTVETKGDVTVVTVDQKQLADKIDAATTNVLVPLPNDTNTAQAELRLSNIEDLLAKDMTLTIQKGDIAYNLAPSAIDMQAITDAFPGADPKNVTFTVTISENKSAIFAGHNLIISPVEFTVTATYDGKTVRFDTFNDYVSREIELTEEQAKQVTTAVVLDSFGNILRHIPTEVVERDGKFFAVINSRTNSLYALVKNNVSFSDVVGKWYADPINEMASRYILKGVGENKFAGEKDVTRAEFATMIVNALGLPTQKTNDFTDVASNAWYAGFVGTAVKYGLISGTGDDKFTPNRAITRGEVMTIVQRAIKLTPMPNAKVNYTDNSRPNDTITRGETATILLRMLQNTGLVDVKSKV